MFLSFIKSVISFAKIKYDGVSFRFLFSVSHGKLSIQKNWVSTTRDGKKKPTCNPNLTLP